jgi:hypothetical protein
MLFTERQQLIAGLGSLVLLAGWGGWLFLKSDHDLARGVVFRADFRFVGALKRGAKVQRSGRTIGRVLGIRPLTRADTSIRVTFIVRKADAYLVRRGAEVFVAAPALLGERHLAIGPPADRNAKAAAPNEIFRGSDPPALDRLLNISWYRVGHAVAFLKRLSAPLVKTTAALDRLQARHKRVQKLWTRARTLSGKLAALKKELDALKSQLPPIIETIKKGASKLILASTTFRRAHRQRIALLSRKIGELQSLFAKAKSIWPPERKRKLAATIATFRKSGTVLKATIGKAQKLLAAAMAGKGFVGRIVNDKEINDDLKDSFRALKKAPWRVLGAPGRGRAKPPRRLPPRRRKRPLTFP